MALILADRVKETTTTTGTGTVTLAGASTGFQGFSAIGDGNSTYYTIAGQTGSEWEVGIGTYTASGTTLSRTTVLSSSNSGSLVSFSAGTKDVFCTYPASTASSVIAGILSWQSVKTANFTAVSGNAYPINTTSGAITVTLPASPSAGNFVCLTDYAGTFGTNNLTIDPNGSKFDGSPINATINTSRESIHVVYIDSTQGWIPYSGFNTSTPIQPYSVDYLVVAGGAGGGANVGGGGGAGGLRTGTISTISRGTVYTITVGAGGVAGVTSGTLQGGTGGDSVFSTITSTGGGGGGYATSAGAINGTAGGSGGGGGSLIDTAASTASGGAGTSGQGNRGGNVTSSARGSGGGGGSSAAGGDTSTDTNGAGGAGTASSISGTSVTYAGGGGGGGYPSNGGAGGSGGGGAGGNPTNGVGTAGTTNRGGGGGGGAGGSAPGGNGGAGGSGVVILSMATVNYSGTQTGGTVTTSGSNTIITYTTSGNYTG